MRKTYELFPSIFIRKFFFVSLVSSLSSNKQGFGRFSQLATCSIDQQRVGNPHQSCRSIEEQNPNALTVGVKSVTSNTGLSGEQATSGAAKLIYERGREMSVVRISKTGDLPLINLLRFKGKPIFDQLILEEKFLRRSSDNWCIINDGTDRPTIVSGLSGKLSQLIEVEKVMDEGMPVIRRFSGGGTVIVDKGTIFVTFICNKGAIDQLQPFPQPIMSWTGQFYSQVLGGAHKFNLRENDYCFGGDKFGGNAQSITKSRWVHHTSFLWDFDAHNMSYLAHPLKMPKYRLERNHIDFLCPMRSILLSRSEFIRKTVSALENHFYVKPMELDEIETDTNDTNEEHQYSTKLMTFEDLGKALAS